MARLRNITTGVIVNVADHKVGRFGQDYVLADASPDVAPDETPAPKKSAKK